MKLSKMKQRQISLAGRGKKALRTQFGALCYRIRKDKVELLLVTTRRTGRWMIPKGWPKDGATPAETAAAEAFEEAGAEGKVKPLCLGIFTHEKTREDGSLPLVVAVYPLKVRRLHAIFPEHGQRRRRWMSRKRAAAAVDNPELAQLIRAFDPKAG